MRPREGFSRFPYGLAQCRVVNKTLFLLLSVKAKELWLPRFHSCCAVVDMLLDRVYSLQWVKVNLKLPSLQNDLLLQVKNPDHPVLLIMEVHDMAYQPRFHSRFRPLMSREQEIVSRWKARYAENEWKKYWNEWKNVESKKCDSWYNKHVVLQGKTFLGLMKRWRDRSQNWNRLLCIFFG